MVFVLAKIYFLKVNQGTERELSGSGVLCKHEDPSLMPRIHVKMVGTVVSMCNPSVGKADIDRSLGSLASQPNLIGEPHTNERPCFKGGKQDTSG